VSGNGPADPSSPKGPSAPPRAGLPALPSPHGQSAPGGHRHPAHGHPERRKALLPGQRGGRESDRARRGGRAGRTRYLGTLIVADLPPGTKGWNAGCRAGTAPSPSVSTRPIRAKARAAGCRACSAGAFL